MGTHVTLVKRWQEVLCREPKNYWYIDGATFPDAIASISNNPVVNPAS